MKGCLLMVLTVQRDMNSPVQEPVLEELTDRRSGCLRGCNNREAGGDRILRASDFSRGPKPNPEQLDTGPSSKQKSRTMLSSIGDVE